MLVLSSLMEIGIDSAELALKTAIGLGSKFADVRLEKKLYNGFLLKNGVVQASSFDETAGIGIRVLVNGTVGFSATNDLSAKGIKNAVSFAVRDAKSLSRMDNNVSLWKSQAHYDDYSIKEKIPIAEVGPDAHLDALFGIDKAIVSTGIKVPFRYLYLSDSVDERFYLNSEGSRITSRIPRVNFYYFLTLSERGRTSQRYWQYGKSSGFEGFEQFDLPGTLSSDAIAMKKNMDRGIKPPKGKVDVVVGPQVTGIMVHESGGHPYEADRILGREAAQAGESFISTKDIGTRIGSSAVSISDDPTIENSFGFYLYDDEGIRAKKKQIVKKGIIEGFFHSRETAASLGTISNASGRSSSFDREPIARMSNTFVEPGDLAEEELVEGIKKGVIIKNFTEWNIDDRRVNQKYVGCEAYMIKNGRIGSPVMKPTIEITTQALYSSIDAVGNNTEYHAGTCGKGEPMQAIPVWFGGPSMRLRRIWLK